jgi:hypothetical protein
MFKKLFKLLLCFVFLITICSFILVGYSAPVKPIVSTLVKQYNGNPCIMINYGDGNLIPYTDVSYMTYVSLGGKQDYYARMAKNGSQSFAFMLTLADSSTNFTQPVWTGVDDSGNNIYDWKQLDLRMESILVACPNAKISLQLFTGAPQAWLLKNDDACVIIKNSANQFNYNQTTIANPNQRYPSMASAKYRAQAGKALQDVVKRVEQKWGGNILGYIITGLATEEWYHIGWHNTSYDDFNADFQKSFRAFVLNKYTNISQVRAAWEKDSAFTENDIAIPPPELRLGNANETFYKTKQSTYVTDFYRFYNEIVPDTIGYFAKAIKQVQPNKVVGCFYAYQLEFDSDPGSGHNALGKLILDKNVDFIKVTAGAVNRYSGTGGDDLRAPLMSALLNNKVIINDNDTVTSMLGDQSTNAFSNETGQQLEKRKAEMTRICGYAPTPELSGAMLERIVMFSAANGFLTTYFDLHGGYYANRIIEKAASDIEKEYKNIASYDRSSSAQMLIVVDEKSCDYIQRQSISGNGFLSSNSIGFDRNITKIGIPYDMILTDDLDKVNISKYKLVWFLNNYYVSDSQRKMIDKVKGNGRTLVWCYAPGIINENGFDINNMSNLTGIKFKLNNTFSGTSVVMNKSNDKLVSTIYNEIYTSNDKTQSFELNDGAKSDQIYIDDSSVTAIGYMKQNSSDKKVQMGYKTIPTNGTWNSLYLPFSDVSTGTMRAIAQFAGVHMYSDKNVDEEFQLVTYDSVCANNNVVSIHANGDGIKKINLPMVSDVYDPLTNQLLYKNASEIKVSMTNAQTKTYLIKPTSIKASSNASTASGKSSSTISKQNKSSSNQSSSDISSISSSSNIVSSSSKNSYNGSSSISKDVKNTSKSNNTVYFIIALILVILIGGEVAFTIYSLRKKKMGK